MKKLILLLAIVFIFGNKLKAQITITDSLNNTDVENLLTGFGVNISNLIINCDAAAIGELNGVSMVPISQGLLLSTGNVNNFIYNNFTGNSTFNQQFTDPDIGLISNASTTWDLCKLEFDCVPQGDTLLFNFAFGSQEYPTFVGSVFNDAFGIFMSGPGINGLQNVAQLPNGDVVAINSVNAGFNSSYFISNTYPDSTGLSYGGFTQNLQVFAITTPGSTYHFKIMITDVSDGVLDSGVLLEAFSFRSPASAVTGIHQQNESTIKLYPNPANGMLTINDFSFNGNTKLIAITDIAGRKVQEFALTQSLQNIDLSSIAEGLYHVTIQSNKGVNNFPLVIKR
ncbi:MAG TPA: choice-of-anchor L domain-containing protein [Bacteroidia bacterium]|nr:choice-of-anchor L domain-containing protein [Bacteroidia bacterium]